MISFVIFLVGLAMIRLPTSCAGRVEYLKRRKVVGGATPYAPKALLKLFGIHFLGIADHPGFRPPRVPQSHFA